MPISNAPVFIFTGAVRAESFTKLPPLLHPASMTDPHLTSGSGTECIPNTTSDDELESEDVVIADEEEETEILQRLTNRHYYSYTAALGVTVGVGCLLLMLNMLIFAGIYYQRERDKRRQSQRRSSRGTPAPSTENIAMTQRPSSPCGSSRQSPVLDKHELPPCYSTLTKNDHSSRQSTLKKEKPLPPVRTSSNPSGGTIKKRVQIQEISV